MLADRSDVTYHHPTTVPEGIHDLVSEATRSPRMLDRLMAHLREVPGITTQAIEHLEAKRPVALRSEREQADPLRSTPTDAKARRAADPGLCPAADQTQPSATSLEADDSFWDPEHRIPTDPGKSLEPNAIAAEEAMAVPTSSQQWEQPDTGAKAARISGRYALLAAVVGAIVLAVLTPVFMALFR
jgi:hypothetical protein